MDDIRLNLTISEAERLDSALTRHPELEEVQKRLELLIVEESIDESYRQDPEMVANLEPIGGVM